ncbi:class I SAM-dependent methyltransferase [Kribbella albertanoniae]|uniref:Class I SAM-dependent methyltransferase n=1 Tax=Kribbella albertanoniae TaxID=1266829 RepID=A0A4R4PID9_9ACTN|nr:class I SAM-dependent methyltransferase [Kribbella albertanoniae]TDC21790.1 class I SAM-dependent methyltransferase [Kribbella albertanoniae]
MTEILGRIRESYNTVAMSYAERVVDGPEWEIEGFDLVTKLADGRPVLDAGCGPGRTTGLLAARGPVIGLDLSPGMIAVARRDHPEVDFRVGSMTALEFADGSFGGVVTWWSIIHLPRDVVPQALAEFHRVLAPGGVLLMGFHVGTESNHKTSGYGDLPMDIWVHRWLPEQLTELAVAAGFTPYQDAENPEDRLVFRK